MLFPSPHKHPWVPLCSLCHCWSHHRHGARGSVWEPGTPGCCSEPLLLTEKKPTRFVMFSRASSCGEKPLEIIAFPWAHPLEPCDSGLWQVKKRRHMSFSFPPHRQTAAAGKWQEGSGEGRGCWGLDLSEATPVSLPTAALHRDLLCSPDSVTRCYLINF